jgi:hypothetical protein
LAQILRIAFDYWLIYGCIVDPTALVVLGLVVLGGVMLSVIVIGPKVSGLNPAEGDGLLRAKKFSARLPSEGK